MDASIIILTKNAGPSFSRLLEVLFSQKFEGNYEILMIDSGSSDETPQIAKRYPVNITKIKPEEFHHGKTRNLGAELASGEILVYITQDALPLNDYWLQSLLSPFKKSNTAMVVGRQMPWEKTKPPEKFFYSYYFPTHKIVVNIKDSEYYRDNAFISNVSSAIRKSVWQKFKFSEQLILTEDKEFAKKVLTAGWNIVYEPEAIVYHAHDFSIRTIFRRSVEYGISLRQGADGLPRSSGSSVQKALGYFTGELKYLVSGGYLKWLPYSVIYETSRYLGTLCGKTRLINN
jgi:rhamnosyltransferase